MQLPPTLFLRVLHGSVGTNTCQIDCQIGCQSRCQKKCHNRCQIECQHICQIDSDRMPERLADRMSECRSDRCHVVGFTRSMSFFWCISPAKRWILPANEWHFPATRWIELPKRWTLSTKIMILLDLNNKSRILVARWEISQQ